MLMSTQPALRELEDAHAFQRRHIGPDAADQQRMLQSLGGADLHGLIESVIPAAIRRQRAFDLPAAVDETRALAELRSIAQDNRVMRSYIGQGYYNALMPGVIQRNVLESPAWYTAYTPYQPEISQGRLEALLNFQTMVADLTGMDVSNASMLDEATAAAEAMTLALRSSKLKSQRFFVADDVLPQTLEVLHTRAAPLDIEVVSGAADQALEGDYFGVLLQYPGADGTVRDDRERIAALKAKGVLVVVAADLLALTLLMSPGEIGADIA
ncbi:MAG: glycine dehydrogenase (aminomethyl-transferring), partial [Thiomonas sp. 20-64-5]